MADTRRDRKKRSTDAKNRDSRNSAKQANSRHRDNKNLKQRSLEQKNGHKRNTHTKEIKTSTVRKRRGRKASMLRSFRKGLKRFFRRIGIVLASFFALFKGIKLPVGLIAGLSAAILIGIIIFIFTNHNALSIEVDGVFVGVIERNRAITAEDLQNTAIAKLAADAGTRVEVLESVTITPINARQRDLVTVDAAIDSIRRIFTYTLEAGIITVNGEEIAIVRNASDAQSILDSIISEFANESATIVDSWFVEDVVITTRFVNSEDIIRSDLALSRLTTTAMADSIYQVQPGDSVWLLSRNHGITQEEFFSMNPGISPDLQIGQFITLTLPTPILSVRTVEELRLIEVAPHATETITNSAQNRNWSRVVQQGRDGQQEATVHIVRVNGFERERVTVNTVITVSPIDEIIEVGTR